MIAIDLGSNSLRCIEYNEETQTFVNECEYIVKTADKIHETGNINDAAVARIIDALQDAKKRLDFAHHGVYAVTTEAARRAKNSEEVFNTIAEQTDVHFSIITAEQEAHYTLSAVKHRLEQLKLQSESFVLIDVGGGSSEVIFHYNNEVITKSFPIGIVSVAQQCETFEGISTHLETLFVDVKTYIEGIYKEYLQPQVFVATAGTPTTMAAYLNDMNYSNYDASKINGFNLTRNATSEVLVALQNMSDDERKFFVGVGRESLIIAGIVIVQKFYDYLGFDTAVVIDDGVREGVAIIEGTK